MNHAPGLECVALLLIRDHQVLAEKRRLTKALAPGTVAIPGGHVETGESLGQALAREAKEELGMNEYLRLEREGGLTWHPIP